MWNLKYNTNKPIYESETESQTEGVDWWLPRGRGVGEAWSGVWDHQMQTVAARLDKQQGPTEWYRELFYIQW